MYLYIECPIIFFIQGFLHVGVLKQLFSLRRHVLLKKPTSEHMPFSVLINRVMRVFSRPNWHCTTVSGIPVGSCNWFDTHFWDSLKVSEPNLPLMRLRDFKFICKCMINVHIRRLIWLFFYQQLCDSWDIRLHIVTWLGVQILFLLIRRQRLFLTTIS